MGWFCPWTQENLDFKFLFNPPCFDFKLFDAFGQTGQLKNEVRES